MASFRTLKTQGLTSDPPESLSAVNMPVVEIDNNLYPFIPPAAISGILPISRGGTGINDLNGGRLIASSEDGTLLEEVDVNVQLLSGLSENIQDQLNKARTVKVNIPTTGWYVSEDGDGYYQRFTVEGMTSFENPVVGLASTAATVAALNLERAAYACIDRIATGPGWITVFCLEQIPKTPFSISLHCTGG